MFCRSTVPSLPSIPLPAFVGSVFSAFPLVTYDPLNTSTAAPTQPTLWLLGPPPPTSSDSLDPFSRYASTLARFFRLDVQTIWFVSPLGAPKAQLPALHLPNGDLLSRDEISAWMDKQLNRDEDASGPTSNASSQAYLSLVRTTLLPAVLSSIYLTHSQSTQVVPPTSLPYLSALVKGYFDRIERASRIAEVKRLRGGKIGDKVVLDLEEVEREACETIEAVEVKCAQQKAGEWWDGNESACELDAWLYALLSIVLELPRTSSIRALKDQLDRSPSLLKWVESKSKA